MLITAFAATNVRKKVRTGCRAPGRFQNSSRAIQPATPQAQFSYANSVSGAVACITAEPASSTADPAIRHTGATTTPCRTATEPATATAANATHTARLTGSGPLASVAGRSLPTCQPSATITMVRAAPAA